MAYITDYQYYNNGVSSPSNANWGSYQYVSLKDIVNNFEMMYSGEDKLIDSVSRNQLVFYAKRAIQELNYDAMKEIKVLELNIDESLRYILPYDYVNWVRVSLYRNGVLVPIDINTNTLYAKSYTQASSGALIFGSDYVVIDESEIDKDRLSGNVNQDSEEEFNSQEQRGYKIDTNYSYKGMEGRKTPSFSIDRASGVINFSSGLESELCILEYVSDGMERGDDLKVSVNKLFESYIYAEIKYQILNSRIGVQEYIVKRSRDERRALWLNAKIRISENPYKMLRKIRV